MAGRTTPKGALKAGGLFADAELGAELVVRRFRGVKGTVGASVFLGLGSTAGGTSCFAAGGEVSAGLACFAAAFLGVMMDLRESKPKMLA